MTPEIKQLLIDLRSEISEIVPEADGHFGKFISALQIKRELAPILDSAGAVIYQEPTIIKSGDSFQPALKTTLTFKDKDDSVSNMLPLPAKPNDPQSLGSALTYMRRQGILVMLGIVPVESDDDGDANLEVPLTERMPQDKLIEVGQLLRDKGIASQADRAKLIDLLAGKKPLNTSGVNRLVRAIKEATPDTLQEALMTERYE